MALSAEEKLAILQMLLERGVEVWTRYKQQRVVAVERVSDTSYVVIRYEDGTADRLRLQHFASRRFVVVL